jgi:hypothetical protein
MKDSSSSKAAAPTSGEGATDSAESRRSVGMLKISGATEGFDRSKLQSHIGSGKSSGPSGGNPTTSASKTSNYKIELGSPPCTSEEGAKYDPVAAATASTPRIGNRGDSVQEPKPQTIDRAEGGHPTMTSGFHMPPEVLGEAESPTKQEPTRQPRKPTALADVNIRARKRSNMAVKATKSQAAAAAAAKVVSGKDEPLKIALDSSIFTLVTYQGVEIIFANTASEKLVGVCSRTHFLFQTLDLASNTPVISISSNSYSGMLIVAHEDGTIQTYRPIPTNPGDPEDTKKAEISPSAFGRFRWVDCITIHAGEVFYQSGETVKFLDRRNAKPGQLADISSSSDHKVLVAHRNQLAVFEASPLDLSEDDQAKKKSSAKILGTLLWTTSLQSNIVTAKMSGDGQALVAVLDEPEEGGDCGALTFIHDMEDGSNARTKPPLERNASVGMVYKSGPFLQHSSPVTRISFRGLGHMTSIISSDDGQGNDLLLTFCEEDSAVRIFNQNSWKQLMLWAAPPNSRADWIRGSSAFSLGDLEPQKKHKSSGSRASSRRPSATSASEMSAGGGINAGLRSSRTLGTGASTTAAGAWIAEITFRGAFPALRLSRLSYMNRGNDDSQPAHFESVAAILPAGSIVAGSVLNADDMGLAIQGIWPAWNPWLSETAGADYSSNDTLSGSAMQFLGLSSVPPPTSAYFGDSYLGGTHSPPTELRIAASHPKTGNLVLMEFPLWGDDDFGAMELGSPVRSVLSLSDVQALPENEIKKDKLEPVPFVSIDYESSRLSAQIDSGARSISLLWRKQGSISLYSPECRKDDSIIRKSILEVAEPSTPDLLQDLSIVPVPLALPPLRLPSGTTSVNQETIISIKWWPDDSFGGPPLLLAITRSAALLLFEIPPPWSVREPAMPKYDPFNGSSHGSASDLYDTAVPESMSDEDELEVIRQEYDVNVTPHPDFGLGLRLESPMDGLPAVAGSFKKHPLNGGMLPAEKTGMIILGDEVLSVNGVSLEHTTFDDIIATVRHVGAEAGPGQPLALRFRPASHLRRHESFNTRPLDIAVSAESEATSGRRPVIGVSQKNLKRKDGASHRRRGSDTSSLASLLVGSFGEAQQEFGRMIAVIHKALPSVGGEDLSSRFVVLPWGKGIGAPPPNKLRGAALMILAVGSKIYAKRLELPLDANPDKARIVDLGSVDLSDEGGEKKEIDETPLEIRTIQAVETAGESRCFLVSDNLGTARLVFLTFTEERKSSQGDGSLAKLEALFRQFTTFGLGADSSDFLVKAASMSLFATMQRNQSDKFRRTIKIWSARPDPSSRLLKSENAIKDEYFDQDYVETEVSVESSDSDSDVADFCFLKTGFLDSFPSLVVFLQSQTVVYQRRGGSLRWLPIIRLTYPSIPGSSLTSAALPSGKMLTFGCPQDTFPHLLPSLRAALSSFDETHNLLSDWHPESLLAHLCMDERGAKVALKGHIQRSLLWLSDLMDNSSFENTKAANVPLLVAPFDSTGGEFLRGDNDDGLEKGVSKESAASLMASTTSEIGTKVAFDDENQTKLRRLLEALAKPNNFNHRVDSSGKSEEFKLAMSSRIERVKDQDNEIDDSLPPILTSMSANELRVLWAVCEVSTNPPAFGKLDAQGQLALTIYSIHTTLKLIPNDEAAKLALKNPSSFSKTPMPSYRVKRSSVFDDKAKLPPGSASAGCVSALISDYQGQLLDCIRQPAKKLDWTSVREMRMPFWIRSDATLRQVSEEVGQNLYRESRDILKAAIFFIVAGKKRTLRNLAAADRTESGQKFFKFMTNFDFSTDRGRAAAEKNAFSLLRKNRYDCAAAFFLLSEPPALKSAVETIASKMEDLDLAFMVARLVGNAQASMSQQDMLGLGGGPIMGFGGLGGGGGGGYAGTGAPDTSEVKKDSETFENWKYDLNNVAEDLLMDRGLPSSYDDGCFSAVQLMWLGRHDEAAHWLSGFLECPDGILPSFSADVKVRRLHQLTAIAKKTQDPTITMTNSFINFASGPFLLKMMQASMRTRFASALLVSNALSRIGVELPAMRSLVQNVDPSSFEESEEGASGTVGVKLHTPLTTQKRPSAQATGQMTSSIFDGFDASKPSHPPPVSDSGQIASTIFDGFDAAPQRKAPQSSSGGMASSIFDSFDAPPAAKPKVGPPAGGEMTSSIFDSFDAPPAAKPKVNASPGGEMASSIFDSFDAPPAAKPKVNSSPGGEMASSIFDSFDAPPAAKPKVNNSPGGEMASSIFDSFDSPPAAKAKINSSPGGEMASSIFDSFDAPPAAKPNISASPGGEKISSIFDGFDAPGAEEPISQVATVSAQVPEDKEPVEPLRRPPLLWLEWREQIIVTSAARRFIREIGSLGARFHIDAFEPVMTPTGKLKSPLIPINASQVLQFHCDGEGLLDEVNGSLEKVCQTCNLDSKLVVNQALRLLDSPYQFHRVCFAVLLHLALKQVDLAEDVVRNTAQALIEKCNLLSFSNDDVAYSRQSISHVSTLYLRRIAAHLSWQLELCLWMHRGGALPLSGLALNETICAVRVGLLLASWNSDFECLETMIRQPPDCLIDDNAGRQLWTSLKIISGAVGGEKKVTGTSSGGWEFLVDCRRAEATELLRPRPTGCFIIRPHPEDHGVFTLSFKTNLVPTSDAEDLGNQSDGSKDANESDAKQKRPSKSSTSRSIKRDDVVQHAIIRLSDSGFRCGSFGPFATLMKLLEAVSSSLPFDLRFDQPPTEGVIKEEGSKPSPNSAFFRKLGLCQAENVAPKPLLDDLAVDKSKDNKPATDSDKNGHAGAVSNDDAVEKEKADSERRKKFGLFLELLVLSEFRKQLSCVAASKYESVAWARDDDADSVGSISDESHEIGPEQEFAVAARILRPLLTWCRMMEIGIVSDLAPRLKDVSPGTAFLPVALNASETAIEISTTEASSGLDGGDAVIRRMIQPGSGVEFRTLRLGDGGESAMVVLFSKKEAVGWFVDNGVEKSEEDALERLKMMERSRVIEPIDLKLLAPKAYKKAKQVEEDEDSQTSGEIIGKGIRYRLVDPWEVEPLESREAETRGASLGRRRFLAFGLGRVAGSCEDVFRSIGGLHLLELWATGRGGVSLTKAIASAHPPWERDAGGDLQLHDGTVAEPVAYVNSIRQNLYRNALFRRLGLPQRFMALIQVELLDLKNLTSPGGSLSLTVYSLLRLKRSRSGAPLTAKARTLDSVATHPMKLGKATGPNAPASWGSLVRFRFPLPEYTAADGRSYDGDREALFKGPPSALQVSVYEKKFMSDSFLGGADVKLDGLSSGGQLEEWVPLRTETHGINWFARIRLTLRFELMCLSPENEMMDGFDELSPSVGLRRIKQLSHMGGAHEDIKKSVSTPDLLSYIESMVY